MTTLETAKKAIDTFLNALPKGWERPGDFKEENSPPEHVLKAYVAVIKKPWNVPGLKSGFSNQQFRIELPKDAPDTFTIYLEGSITEGSDTILFSGTMAERGGIRLEAQKTLKLSSFSFPDLSKSGLSSISDWMGVLPLQAGNQLHLTFLPAHSGMQIYHSIRTELASDYCIGETAVCLSHPYLAIEIVHTLPETNGSPAFSGRIGAELMLGKPVDVEVRLSPAGPASLKISGKNDEGLPGPADLLKALGFEKEGTVLTDALAQTPFIKDLFIDGVEVNFDLKTKQFRSGRLFGHLNIPTSDIRFSMSYPNMVLRANLNPKKPIEVMQLLKDEYPDLGGLPSNLKVSNASIGLQMDPLSFSMSLTISDIWKASIGSAEVTFDRLMLHLDYAKEHPLTGSLGANFTIGGVDFHLLAERVADGKKSGWHFKSTAAHSSPIQLKGILEDLTELFGIPAPNWMPQTEISNILIDFNTLKKTVELTASASIKEKVGPFDTTALDLHIKVDKEDKDRPLQININGKLQIEGSLFEFKTDFGNKNWFIDATWDKADGKGFELMKLVQSVDRNSTMKAPPKELTEALTLRKIGFSYYNENSAFELQAENELGIAIKFNLFKDAKKGWGAILGIHYAHQANKIPVAGGVLEKISGDVKLVGAWLIAAYVPDGVTKTPFKTSSLAWPMEVSKMGKGLVLTADLAIQSKASGPFGNLKKVLPEKPELTIRGQINFAKKELSIGVDSKHVFTFPTQDGKDFVIRNCGIELMLSMSAPSIEVHGDMEFFLDQYKVEAGIDIKLNTKGIELSGYAEVPEGGIPLFGLKEVTLHGIGIGVGVKFTPPSVTFALQGEMTFRNDAKVKDYFGAKLAFSSPVPVPLYFAMDISKISFTEIVRNLQFKAVNGGNYVPEKMVTIEALSFQYASEKTKLPDRTTVDPGVSFHGLFTINDFKAWIEFQASEKGIEGLGQFSKIDTPDIKVSGGAKDLKRMAYFDKNAWHPVSNANRLLPGVVPEERVILKGGGPIISFSTIKSPYLRADFYIKILDVSETKVDIEISDKGLMCKLLSEFKGIYYLDLDVTINPPETVHSIGKFSAGPRVELPFSLQFPFITPSNFGLNISGSQNIRTGSKEDFYFDFHCQYTIMGYTSPELKIHFDHSPRNFGDFFEMAMKTFYENIPFLFCEFLIPKPFRFICNRPVVRNSAGGGQRLKRTAPLTNVGSLNWLSEAIELTQPNDQKRMKSGNPMAKLEKLVERAQTENQEEIERMHAVKRGLDDLHTDVIRDGKKRLEAEIKRIEREISDLEDRNHVLENAIIETWNKHLAAYKDTCFELFEAESTFARTGKGNQRLQRARKAATKMETVVQSEISKFAIDYDPNKGYSARKNTWAAVAVEHHSELVKLKVDTGIERSYLAQKKMEVHDFSGLERRSSKQPIVIKAHLKQIDDEGNE